MTNETPLALRLAEMFELEDDPESVYRKAAAELRRQYEEIEALKTDLKGYMLAANAEAELVDELTKEVEALRAERKPLTDDQIDVIWAKQQTKPFKSHSEDRIEFARAIEAAHGIKGETK